MFLNGYNQTINPPEEGAEKKLQITGMGKCLKPHTKRIANTPAGGSVAKERHFCNTLYLFIAEPAGKT